MSTRYTYLKAATIAVSVIILIVTTILVGQRTLAKNDADNSNMGLIWFTSDRDNPSTAGMCGNCESIYVTSANGSDPERLTKNGADEVARWNDNAPAWSLVAKRIAFQTNRNGHPQIFLMRADGTEQTLLADLGATPEGVQVGAQFPSWSPNGEQLCFSSVRQPRDIYVINADGSGLTNVSNRSC